MRVLDGRGGAGGTAEGRDGAVVSAWPAGSLTPRPLGIQSGGGPAAVLPGQGGDDHWSRADWASHGGMGSPARFAPCPSEAWRGADGFAAALAATGGG